MGETMNYFKMLVNSPNRKRSGERQNQMGDYMKFMLGNFVLRMIKLILVDQELVQWLDFCNGSMKFRFIKQDVCVFCSLSQ